MADFIDKAMLIGAGVEKKIKDLLSELEEQGEEGKKARAEGAGEGGEELKPGQRVENRIVDEGIKAVREVLSVLKGGTGRVGDEVGGAAENFAGKLHLATSSELDIVKEMARVAREKVDELEKRLSALEGKTKK